MWYYENSTTQGDLNMYGRIASRICERLIQNHTIPERKRAVYLYGFEVILSSFVYFLIFLFTSIISKCLTASLFFWLGIFIIRKIAGGHHAKSYLSCHLLFESNHIIFILLLHFVSSALYAYIILASLTIAILSILFFAPIDHKNKPFIKTEYKRYRLFCLVYCALLATATALYWYNVIPNHLFMFSFSIGTLSATISLLCGKIINYKERRAT